MDFALIGNVKQLLAESNKDNLRDEDSRQKNRNNKGKQDTLNPV